MGLKRMFSLIVILCILMPALPARAENLPAHPGPKASGGPDAFGYTWDDAAAISWIDTTAGTDTGYTGSPSIYVSTLVSLPFTFKFFEKSYSSLYLVPRGYLSFSDYTGWPDQSPLPDSFAPNDLVVPYMAPMSYGPNSWLHYLTGGSAPDRYFVAEWHAMQSDGDTYSFEVILYENGDIAFLYGNMVYTITGSACATAGIEDSRGVDGLAYLPYCTKATSNRQVKFTRPAASARVTVTPAEQGSFASPSAVHSFPLTLINTGDLGSDTFDLAAASAWPVSFFAADGLTPLGDSDGDGVVDTGLLLQGSATTITAKVSEPGGLTAGESNLSAVTITSPINTNLSGQANLSMTVPAGFAQVFMDGNDTDLSFMTAAPAGVVTHSLSDNRAAADMVVTTTRGGGFLAAWDALRMVGANVMKEVEYVLVKPDGSLLRPVGKVADLSLATNVILDMLPSLAATPDGHLGLAWLRVEYDALGQASANNIYFSILDSAGNMVYGPVKITNLPIGSAAWVDRPSLTATDDNHFLLAWDLYNSTTFADNIWLAGYSSTGAGVFAPRALTMDNISWGQALNSLPGGPVILTSAKYGSGPYYSVLSSSGAVIRAATNLNSGGSYTPADAAPLRSGRTAIVWGTASGVKLGILDAGYNLLGSVANAANASTAGGNTGMSVTSDPAGRIIMTWLAGDNETQLHALANGSGVFTAVPQAFRTSRVFIDVADNGQGNAPISRFGDVPVSYWAAPWVEGLAAAGVTSGCSSVNYCPEALVTRAQMAVFLLRGVHGSAYIPPVFSGSFFTDVPNDIYAPFIEQLAREGITSGCGIMLYCPNQAVTRAQMAVFLLRAEHGSAYVPPPFNGTIFTDVSNDLFGRFIEQLANEGITSGCGVKLYCPNQPVTRAQMSVFLVRTFHLPFDAPVP